MKMPVTSMRAATALFVFLVASLDETTTTLEAFAPLQRFPRPRKGTRTNTNTGATGTITALCAWSVDSNEEFVDGDGIHQWIDPSAIRFEDSKKVTQKLMAMAGILSNENSEETSSSTAAENKSQNNEEEDDDDEEDVADEYNGAFPYALMMQVSAPYIASHTKKVAVFHIPGALLLVNGSKSAAAAADKLLSDIHMSWMLGMKIVLVLGSSYDWDVCDFNNNNGSGGSSNGPVSLRQCYPKSRRRPSPFDAPATSSPSSSSAVVTTCLLEEEAGFLRTEVERKLNRFMQKTCLGGARRQNDGNVVSGNFYTATRLRIRSPGLGQQNHNGDDEDDDDFAQSSGYASEIHVDKIQRILQQNNDIVVLTTVGQTRRGNVVNVNGHQLTAAVAAALQAHKVIYMASQGCVLQQQIKNDQDGKSTSTKRLFELPLSIAQSITNYHHVHVRQGKFATIQDDINSSKDTTATATSLGPRAVELLLNMAWACWAVDRGVRRAHIVNPTDGALLEELFTSRNGANMCLYHDNELLMNADDDEDEDDDEEDAEELLFVTSNDDDDDDYHDDFGMSSSSRRNNNNTPFSSMPPSSSLPPSMSAADFLEELRQKRRRSSSDSFQ